MNALVLVLIFLAAIAVAGCVVAAFSTSIDGVLLRLLSGEMAAAWSKYAKFALFVASFTGGLRLNEIQALAGGEAQASMKLGQCLMEVYKTIAGTLGGASWTLLIFFGATLAAYLASYLYSSLKAAPRQQRVGEPQSPMHAGRL